MISRKYPSTRLRRLRQSESIIDLISECAVTKNDLIQTVFVKEGLSDKEPIESMPGIFRFGEDSVLKEIEEISRLGIRAIAIFPVIDPSKKDSKGTEAIKRDNFISRVLGSIKSKFPEMLVIADVALDPYTDHGHDGILENDEILNDQTLDVLAEQSLVLAEAGADIIAPSDMMDGRIGVIRKKLDENNFEDKIILSYAAKYNSKFYGPFSDDEMKKKIDECNNFLNLINADCNSAVAVDYKDEVLQAEVYGKNEYIKFSALNAEEAFMRFKELDGLRLLNEHS